MGVRRGKMGAQIVGRYMLGGKGVGQGADVSLKPDEAIRERADVSLHRINLVVQVPYIILKKQIELLQGCDCLVCVCLPYDEAIRERDDVFLQLTDFIRSPADII